MIAELTLSQHLVPVLQYHPTVCKFIIPMPKIALLLSGKWSSLIPPIKWLGLTLGYFCLMVVSHSSLTVEINDYIMSASIF